MKLMRYIILALLCMQVTGLNDNLFSAPKRAPQKRQREEVSSGCDEESSEDEASSLSSEDRSEIINAALNNIRNLVNQLFANNTSLSDAYIVGRDIQRVIRNQPVLHDIRMVTIGLIYDPRSYHALRAGKTVASGLAFAQSLLGGGRIHAMMNNPYVKDPEFKGNGRIEVPFDIRNIVGFCETKISAEVAKKMEKKGIPQAEAEAEVRAEAIAVEQWMDENLVINNGIVEFQRIASTDVISGKDIHDILAHVKNILNMVVNPNMAVGMFFSFLPEHTDVMLGTTVPATAATIIKDKTRRLLAALKNLHGIALQAEVRKLLFSHLDSIEKELTNLGNLEEAPEDDGDDYN